MTPCASELDYASSSHWKECSGVVLGRVRLVFPLRALGSLGFVGDSDQEAAFLDLLKMFARRVADDTSGRRLTAATPGTATTRASRGIATAGKGATPTFSERICSTRRSSSLCLPPTRTRRSSAPPSSAGGHVPPRMPPTPHPNSDVWRLKSREPGPPLSATTAPSRTAGCPSRGSAVESMRLSVG
jgi:hypothetical protein